MDARKVTAAAATRLTADWSRILPGRVPALLAIALALFIVAVVALNANLVRLKESFSWVEHTNEVLRDISAIERALLEAESAERG